MVLSGEDNWKGLLDPLDIDLRQQIIHYGEMAQATYDNFISNKLSKYAGSNRYAKQGSKYRPVRFVPENWSGESDTRRYTGENEFCVRSDRFPIRIGLNPIRERYRFDTVRYG
ncbi:unnamed protein product [Camellia sinensis]